MSSISNITGSNSSLYMQSPSYGVHPGDADRNAQGPSSAEITQAVKQINGIFRQSNQSTYAAVEKDAASGLEVVKFVDQNTRQTINQFPSKAVVAVAQQLQHAFNSRGQLVNTNA